MSRVLITGVGGFLGRHLAQSLNSQGVQWAALVRPNSQTRIRERLRLGVDVNLFECDLKQPERWAEQVVAWKPTCVYHLATHFLVNHSLEDVHTLIESNVLLGTQLLESLQALENPTVIYAESYWQRTGPNHEESWNLYAATKSAFDPILHYYTQSLGLRTIQLVLYDIYGPDDDRGKVLSMLDKASREQTDLDLSPGNQQLDLLHVKDIVRGLEIARHLAATQPAGSIARYHLSNLNRISLRDLAKEFARATGRKLKLRWGARPYREGEIMAPNSPDTMLPSWEPQITLADGLRQVYG